MKSSMNAGGCGHVPDSQHSVLCDHNHNPLLSFFLGADPLADSF